MAVDKNTWALIETKATLLSIGLLRISEDTIDTARSRKLKLAELLTHYNLTSSPWLFLKLDNRIRVRMIVDNSSSSQLELVLENSDDDHYQVVDGTGNLIAWVTLEESIWHCPEQLFFDMYTICVNDCKYCPLPIARPKGRDTIKGMLELSRSTKDKKVLGIGITSGVPPHLNPDELAEEMARSVEALRKEWGDDLPIGVSPFPCSRTALERLHNAGATEIRMNTETFSRELFPKVCPDKDLEKILACLEDAVAVFGRNKVSSNMIAGLGETDREIQIGVETLCRIGVIPTVYPIDPIPGRFEQLLEITDGKAQRPSAKRLLSIAKMHKEKILEYGLDPTQLKTMCPGCTASHIMPGIEF